MEILIHNQGCLRLILCKTWKKINVYNFVVTVDCKTGVTDFKIECLITRVYLSAILTSKSFFRILLKEAV